MQREDFNSLINSHPVVLADMYADWCEPCKMLDVILDELKTLTEEKVRIVKVDVDASPEISSEFNVKAVPVLLLFKDGRPVWRMNGFMMAPELHDKIREFT